MSTNESMGSISPVSDEAAAPHTPVMNEEVTDVDVEDDGSDLSADGVESTQVQEAADAIDAAQKAGDISKAQAQSMKKKLKLKVNGVEEEVEFDLGDEQALVKELQKSRAFDRSAKEHAGFKAQVDQAFLLLQQDPAAFLERMGIDVDGLSEKQLSKKIEEMKKTPEQIANEKMTKELEELRKEKKAADEARKNAEADKMRNAAAQAIENDITEVLSSSDSFLPKRSPRVLSKVSHYMLMAMKNGYPEVTAKDVMPMVEKDFMDEISELFDGASEDRLEKIVGKANLDKYRKSKISKKKATPSVPVKPKIEDTGSSRKEEKEETERPKIKMKDLFGYRPKS